MKEKLIINHSDGYIVYMINNPLKMSSYLAASVNNTLNKPLIITIVMWFIISLVTEPFVAAFLIKNLNTDLYNVNDMFFSILPYIDIVYDYYSTPLLVIAIITIMIAMYKSHMFLYTSILTMANIFHLRNISILLTTLPLVRHDIDDTRCVEYSTLSYNEILKHTFLGFECSDYFFSGHTMFYTLGFIAICKLVNTKILLIIMFPVYISCLLSLLVARVHYTIDVVFGVYLTLTMHYCISPAIVKWFNNNYFRQQTSELNINIDV